MSAMLESKALNSVVEKATPEQRRYLLDLLVRCEVAGMEKLMQSVHGESGAPIGFFVPLSLHRDRPPMTDEAHAELLEAVRSTRPEDLISHEQLLQELGLEEAPRASRQ